MSRILLKSEMDKLTEKIIGCAYAVSNTLGSGFVEKVYENALTYQILKTGLRVQQQYPITVKYDGIIVGEFLADLLVEEQVLIELKTTSLLGDPHMAQALNYLRATELLFVF